MIHEKWVISDTHFFHTNILKFIDDQGHRIRPFNSIDEMHSTIVNNHNSVVGTNDYVYWLGDVTFQYHRLFHELMYSLKGDKRLIVGNHDKLKQEGLLKHFSKVEYWKGFKELNFTMTHIPHRLESLRDGKYNVHGHTHQRFMEDPHYINACVEANNFAPMHFDEIVQMIKINEEKGKP